MARRNKFTARNPRGRGAHKERREEEASAVQDGAGDVELPDADTVPSMMIRKANGKVRMRKKAAKRLGKANRIAKQKELVEPLRHITDVEMIDKSLTTTVELPHRSEEKTTKKQLKAMTLKVGGRRRSVKGTPLAMCRALDPCKRAINTVEGRPMSKKKARKLAKRKRYAEKDQLLKMQMLSSTSMDVS